MIVISILQTILTNILKGIYEPFGFAILLAVFFMFFYLFAKATSWKRAVKIWLEVFRKSAEFRKMFLFAFYVALMLFRTLLNRSIWSNPLSNVMGGWGLRGDDGKFSTEAIENVFLFIPFILLLFWTFSEKLWRRKKVLHMMAAALGISFGTSLGIEFLQLLLCLGTFQLADLFYNTLGGVLGGALYVAGMKGKEAWKKAHLEKEKGKESE